MCFFGSKPKTPDPIKMPPANPVPLRADEQRRQGVLAAVLANSGGMGRSATILAGGARPALPLATRIGL